LQALAALGGQALPNELREQVIEDTLRGAPEAKSAWTERGMLEDVTKGLDAVRLPVTMLVGDRDQVEHEDTLKEVFARFLPQATFRQLRGVGHLSPLEAPDAVAGACNSLLHDL
jgi:pimeloyl-ACP methyl ester carboxylesterase